MDRLRKNEINEKQKKLTVAFAVWGGAVIALILLVTTVWVSNSARVGTKRAVGRVSEFYLEELAGRRAQVVSEELKNHFTYMENALNILKGLEIDSQDSLRGFLGRVKRLYGLDKFALVDENGIVYTEHSTASGLSRYAFLSQELKEPVVNTSSLYGAKRQVILAMPVEGITFQGSRIEVCFIQINISEMLSSLTMQTSQNDTYINLYHRSGESLTSDDFGYLTAGRNLLSALTEAHMRDGASYERLREDFAEGRMGQVSLDYQGVKEELCYIPVEGTDWMLTILIRDNVINEQISAISSEMMNHGIIQIVITVVAMLGVFLVLIHQSKKSAGILLQQEKADNDRIRAAYAQVKTEQTAMENIHAAMRSGLWSMEFDKDARMTSCIWSDVFRSMVGYGGEEEFPNRLESWTELLHTGDRERVLKEFWDTVRDYSYFAH